MPSPLRIPHAPLSDTEWQAILPHLPIASTGRPCDLRARLDAIFRLAATDGPWRDLPEPYGNHDTIARYFRRLTHDGLWERLLFALAAAAKSDPIRRLEGLICRATRRAIRLRGLPLIFLIRRLNLMRALPAPPWMCPNPALSRKLFALPLPQLTPVTRERKEHGIAFLRALRHSLGLAAGRSRISARRQGRLALTRRIRPCAG